MAYDVQRGRGIAADNADGLAQHTTLAAPQPHESTHPSFAAKRTHMCAHTPQRLLRCASWAVQELVTLVLGAGRLLASSPIARDSLAYSTIRFVPRIPPDTAVVANPPAVRLTVLRMGSLLLACRLPVSAVAAHSHNQGQPSSGPALIQLLRPGLPQFSAFFAFAARANTRTVLPPLPFQSPGR